MTSHQQEEGVTLGTGPAWNMRRSTVSRPGSWQGQKPESLHNSPLKSQDRQPRPSSAAWAEMHLPVQPETDDSPGRQFLALTATRGCPWPGGQLCPHTTPQPAALASPEQAWTGSGTESADGKEKGPPPRHCLQAPGMETTENSAATTAGTGLDVSMAPNGHLRRPSPGEAAVPIVDRPKLALDPDQSLSCNRLCPAAPGSRARERAGAEGSKRKASRG
nr:uncharacterized protein LOC106845551 isoform X2 [Equus asinus]